MKVEDAVKIKKMLETAYPSTKATTQKDELERDMLYSSVFTDYDYKIMNQAVISIIKKLPYPPSIAHLIQEYETLKEIERQQDEKYLIKIVDEMDDKGLFETNTNFKVMSEYEKTIASIMEKNISNNLRCKILDYAKSDERIKRILGNNLVKTEDRR